MQTLDVISINLWNMVASLANLAIIFWIVKKFLYKPVKKMLDARQATIDGDYLAAQQARQEAENSKEEYTQRLSAAKDEAEEIIQSAVAMAKLREKEIIASAKADAGVIVRQAHENASLEMKKAEATIKEEIVDVSARLTEKLLGREIAAEDHKELIDSFIDEIGADDGGNK